VDRPKSVVRVIRGVALCFRNISKFSLLFPTIVLSRSTRFFSNIELSRLNPFCCCAPFRLCLLGSERRTKAKSEFCGGLTLADCEWHAAAPWIEPLAERPTVHVSRLLFDEVLACTEFATSEYSTASQCLKPRPLQLLRARPSMSAVFLFDENLACMESATSEYSTTSQCLSTLLRRPGRVKFILDGVRWMVSLGNLKLLRDLER